MNKALAFLVVLLTAAACGAVPAFDSKDILGSRTSGENEEFGDAANKPEFQKYAPAPELIWDSLEDCDKALKNMTVPVGYCFGTQDPVSC